MDTLYLPLDTLFTVEDLHPVCVTFVPNSWKTCLKWITKTKLALGSACS